MAKKYLEVYNSQRVSTYDLEGKVVDVIAQLQAYVKSLGDGVTIEYETGYFDGEDSEYVLRWKRLETDEERAGRLARARVDKANKLTAIADEREGRRKMYERLRTEFE